MPATGRRAGSGEPGTPPDLIGRDREIEAIERWLEDPSGSASAMIMQGPAGMGKTSLWRHGCASAAAHGTSMLRAQPTEVEADLPLVGLLDLLDSARGSRTTDDDLREAADAPFDPVRLGRALTAFLSDIARAGPVVVAIDDVQWLDPATERVLRFAIRRVSDQPVRTFVTRRDDGDTGVPLGLDRAAVAARLTSMVLGGLTVEALDAMLRARLGLRLPRPRLVELWRLTDGNPLFALELAPALASGVRDRLPASLDEALAERIARLSAGARTAVLLVAASLHRQADEIERAGATDALSEAIAQGVISVDRDRVRFSHPLLATVAYERALPSERRAAHRRLVEVSGAADERALHLARGAEGQDAALAQDLEDVGVLVADRGGAAIAAEVVEAAGRLTPTTDVSERRRRVFLAAELHEVAGDPAHGRELVEKLVDEMLPGRDRAVLLRWLADRLDGSMADCIALAEQALGEASTDRALCAEIRNTLSAFHRIAGDLDRSLEQARAAVADADASGDERRLAVAIAAACELEMLRGLVWDRGAMMRALDVERRVADIPPWDRPSFQLGLILLATDELDAAAPVLRGELERVRAQVNEPGIFHLLVRVSDLDLRAGRWSAALEVAREAHALSGQGGIDLEESLTGSQLGTVLAHLGDLEQARDLGQRARRIAEERGHQGLAIRSAGLLGYVTLMESDPEGALEWLTPARQEYQRMGQGELSSSLVVANEIDALILAGRLDEAEAVCSFVEDAGRPAGRAWNRAIAYRGRALVAAARGDEAAAERAMEAALAAHKDLPQPFELARTLLAAGSVERRRKHWAAARERFTVALERFDGLGAARWAERAALELTRLPGRRPGTSELTETERQVAQLVAEGLSNREVAGRLYLSVRTVEANLSRVYDKLGIRSRAELVRRFSSS